MWEVVKHYPLILNVIERAARTGGKENAVTLLASHAYEDFTGSRDVPNPIGIALAKTAGVKLIGKQVGDYRRLIEDTGLSPAAQVLHRRNQERPWRTRAIPRRIWFRSRQDCRNASGRSLPERTLDFYH